MTLAEAANISVYLHLSRNQLVFTWGTGNLVHHKRQGPGHGDSFRSTEYGTGNMGNGGRGACMVLKSWFRARQEIVGECMGSETKCLVWKDAAYVARDDSICFSSQISVQVTCLSSKGCLSAGK